MFFLLLVNKNENFYQDNSKLINLNFLTRKNWLDSKIGFFSLHLLFYVTKNCMHSKRVIIKNVLRKYQCHRQIWSKPVLLESIRMNFYFNYVFKNLKLMDSTM